MTTITDDHLRALMSRVEELTPPSPEFDALGVRRAERDVPQVRTRRFALVTVGAAIVVLLAGLVFIGSRDDRAPHLSAERLTTHSVVTRLPDGWEAKGAIDGKPDVESAGQTEFHLYATPVSPTGPVFAVVDTWAGTFADEATQTNVVLADGRRGALGDTRLANARSLDVEVEPGRWVAVIARHISDADLLAIGTLVGADAQGTASVAGALPLGLVPAGEATFFGGVLTATFATDANELPLGSAVTGYGPIGAPFDTSIRAFAPTASSRAMLGLSTDVSALSAVGAAADRTFSSDSAPYGDHGAYVERDGIGFLATSPTLDAAQLADMLSSLRPVGDAAWAQLVTRHDETDPSPPAGATTVTSQPPPPSVAPGAPDPTPVAVAYAVAAASDGYDAAATVPAGEVVIHLRPVGRSTIIDVSLDGTSMGSTTISQTGGSIWNSRDLDGSSFYVSVVPVDDPTAEMRVTVDGLVYVTKFVTIDPSAPVRVAMILVPPQPGRTAAPAAHTYDADGNPLESLG